MKRTIKATALVTHLSLSYNNKPLKMFYLVQKFINQE
jgi:hypothetical protein